MIERQYDLDIFLRTVISYIDNSKRRVRRVLFGKDLVGESLGGHVPQTGDGGHGTREYE